MMRITGKKTLLDPKTVVWDSVTTIFLALAVLGLTLTTGVFDSILGWFKQFPKWYDGYIMGSIVIMLILFVFAWRNGAYYRKEIIKRKQAEEEAAHSLQYVKTISLTSSRLVKSIDLDKDINDALADIGQICNANRAFVFIFRNNEKKMDNTHEWYEMGLSSQKTEFMDIDCDAYTWSMDLYRRNEALLIHNVSEVPAAAIGEKEMLMRLGAKSLISVPIQMNGSTVGFFGVSSSVENKWNERDLLFLQILSQIASTFILRWRAEKEFHIANNELETRVWERTVELEKLNNVLQKEIMDRKKMEKTLAQSEERYRRLVEILPDAIIVHCEGKIIFANYAAAQMAKASSTEELIGRSIMDFVHPDYSKVVAERIERITRGEAYTETIEEKFIILDGSCIDAEISTILFPYKGQNAVLAIIHDISKRKRMEEVLRQSKKRYRDLIEYLPEAVMIHTVDQIVFANRAAARLLGVESFKQLIGKSILDFMKPCHRSDIIKHFSDVIDRGKRISHTPVKMLKENGSTVDTELAIVPMYYGEKMTAMVAIRDLTERKETEHLNRLLHETMENDKLRTEFLSNITHELKTPLNVLLGTIQLLDLLYKNQENGDSVIDIRKYTGIMRQNCYRLLRLVNNLIDITRIDSGFYQLSMSNQNIVSTIEEICMSVVEYIQSKGIQFEFDTDAEEKIMAFDPDKMERVMLNLLSNAIKFTNAGGSIKVHMHDMGDKVRIAVKDTGIGVPEDQQEAIFDRFKQVDESLSRNSEGSGIGLSLVKSIVQLHGGNVLLHSEVGKGSEFIIELPVRITQEEAAPKHNHNMHRSQVERIQIEFSDIYR